mgnify:CR=1 FL=1
MKKYLFTITLLFSINLGFSQDDNYKNLLTEYLNSQGTIETFDTSFAQMVNMFGAKLDEEKFKTLTDEINFLIKIIKFRQI